MNKRGNIFDSFEDAAAQRKQEQEQIEAVVLGTRNGTGRARKRGADATTITLSISREDKELVRALAEKRSVSISDLLHQWIRQAYEP